MTASSPSLPTPTQASTQPAGRLPAGPHGAAGAGGAAAAQRGSGGARGPASQPARWTRGAGAALLPVCSWTWVPPARLSLEGRALRGEGGARVLHLSPASTKFACCLPGAGLLHRYYASKLSSLRAAVEEEDAEVGLGPDRGVRSVECLCGGGGCASCTWKEKEEGVQGGDSVGRCSCTERGGLSCANGPTGPLCQQPGPPLSLPHCRCTRSGRGRGGQRRRGGQLRGDERGVVRPAGAGRRGCHGAGLGAQRARRG